MTIPDSDLDAIEARAKAVDGLQCDMTGALPAAIDKFDETAVSDVLRLVAEVRRLRAGLARLRETMRQMVEDLGGDET